MIRLEKYFEDLYEYVDLWASGLVKAYMPKAEGEKYLRLKARVVESILDRFDVINRLRKTIGLDEMNVEECYDYYVNNVPEFDEKAYAMDLYTYDKKTKEMAAKEPEFKTQPNAQAYLIVMGAPDVFVENSSVLQDRIDSINNLLVAAGHQKITPQKTEEILTKLLTVSNW